MYVDCSRHPGLCGHYEVSAVPAFRYIAPGEQYAVDEKLTSVRGENIVPYMNAKCGTRFLRNGHYDEMYGRTLELDILAHEFMALVC